MQKILFLIIVYISLFAESELPEKENIDNTILEYSDLSQNNTIDGSVNRYMQNSIDIEDYIKVSLIDVVLETVSQSNNAKAAREKVRQAKIKIDNAKADYLPSINGTYKFGTTDSYPGDDGDNRKNYNDESYKLSVTQNIYKGGSTQYSVSNLEKKYEIEKNNYKSIVVKEIENAVKAYFDVLFNYKSLNANIDNMVRLNDILEIINIKYESGAASIGNLSNVKASVSNAESKLIKVQSKFNESLEFYLYIVGDNFLKTFPYEDDFDTSVEDFEKLVIQAIENNIKIRNYELNIEAEKFNLKKATSPFKPQIDLELSGENVLDQEDYENDEQNYKAQVVMTYNFYNKGKDKNQILKVNSIIRELQFRKNEEIRKLKWSLSKLHRSIISITNASDSKKEEVSASESMVVAYWDGFKLGEQDLQELLQGQRQLNTAQLELISNKKSAITDYFKLLDNTGEILNYFRLDMDADNYIDFTKSHYRHKLQAELNDLSLDAPEVIEEIDIKSISDLNTTLPVDINITEVDDINNTEILPITETDSLGKLVDYESEFLNSLSNKWTIWIHNFDKLYNAFEFANEKDMSDDIFVFDTLVGNKIKSNIAYEIFDTEELAINSLFDLNITSKNTEVLTTEDIKIKYEKFKNRKFQTEVKKKSKPKVKVFETDAAFKNKFLSAPLNYYTINITSFSSFKDAEVFVKAQNIVAESFIFTYGEDKEWTKVMYGVYASYEEATEALNSLVEIKEKYEPIIEIVESKQTLFTEFNEYTKPDEKFQIEEPIQHIEIEVPEVKESTKIIEEIELDKDSQIENTTTETQIEELPVKEEIIDDTIETEEVVNEIIIEEDSLKVEAVKENILDTQMKESIEESLLEKSEIKKPIEIVEEITLENDAHIENNSVEISVEEITIKDEIIDDIKEKKELRTEVISKNEFPLTDSYESLQTEEPVNHIDIIEENISNVSPIIEQSLVEVPEVEESSKILEEIVVEEDSQIENASLKTQIEDMLAKEEMTDDAIETEEIVNEVIINEDSLKVEAVKENIVGTQIEESIEEFEVKESVDTEEEIELEKDSQIENASVETQIEDMPAKEEMTDDAIEKTEEIINEAIINEDSLNVEAINENIIDTQIEENLVEVKMLDPIQNIDDSSEIINEESIVEDNEMIEISMPITNSDNVVETEVVNNEIKTIKTEIEVERFDEEIFVADTKSFKEVFLSAPKDAYSINLATLIDEQAVETFTKKYEGKMDFFIFQFGADKTYFKVMTGVFESKGEAYLAVENLDENFQKNTPRVEIISIKQNLFYKYNTIIPPKSLEEVN